MKNKLLKACQNLEGLLTADLNALQPWQKEIDALLKAMRAEQPRVFVMVSGGAAYPLDQKGKSLFPDTPIIDLDVIESGVCPICGEDHERAKKCATCGLPLDNPSYQQAIRTYRKYYGE